MGFLSVFKLFKIGIAKDLRGIEKDCIGPTLRIAYGFFEKLSRSFTLGLQGWKAVVALAAGGLVRFCLSFPSPFDNDQE